MAAESDPGWVAKLSPELEMSLRDPPERAELEPLASVLEVSVPVTTGGVSDPCSKGGHSYRGLSGWEPLGILAVWCSSGTKPESAIIADRLGDSTHGW